MGRTSRKKVRGLTAEKPLGISSSVPVFTSRAVLLRGMCAIRSPRKQPLLSDAREPFFSTSHYESEKISNRNRVRYYRNFFYSRTFLRAELKFFFYAQTQRRFVFHVFGFGSNAFRTFLENRRYWNRFTHFWINETQNVRLFFNRVRKFA